jgi:hypothetical protein
MLALSLVYGLGMSGISVLFLILAIKKCYLKISSVVSDAPPTIFSFTFLVGELLNYYLLLSSSSSFILSINYFLFSSASVLPPIILLLRALFDYDLFFKRSYELVFGLFIAAGPNGVIVFIPVIDVTSSLALIPFFDGSFYNVDPPIINIK